MEPDGTVTLTTGLQSNGQGHETTMAQLAADELGIKLEDVKVVQGDRRDGVRDRELRQPHRRDRQRRHHPRRRRRARQAARHRRPPVRGAPDDLELGEGRISVLGSPEKSFTIREVATAAYWGPRPDDIDPALIATRSYDPPETYSNACIAVVAEVDAETGQVHIERIVAVEDCGTVLNPAVVEGQVDRRDRTGHRQVLLRAAAVRRGRATSSRARSSTSSTRPRPRYRRSRSTTSRRRPR